MLGLAWSSCQSQPHYELDHVILFVTDSTVQQQLETVCTRGEKMATRHTTQGTYGEYFLLMNTCIELLYLESSEQAKANEAAFRSAYTQRWLTSAGSPIGIGLKMHPFDTAQIEFPYRLYSSGDAPEDEYYVMANGNTHSQAPLVFITLPHREQKVFRSMKEVEDRVDPAIREDVISYLTHPAQLKRLTSLRLTLPPDAFNTPNTDILRHVPGIEVYEGDAPRIELECDEGAQGKKRMLDNAGAAWLYY